MKPLAHIIVLAILAWPVITLAGDWQSRLQDGSVVTVDPDTNRATVQRNGVTAPLWDGHHRTEDGSLLIIKRGIATPNKAIIESRRAPPPRVEDWEDAPIVGYSPCERLVRTVCGKQDECADVEACELAWQLLTMEQEERINSANQNLMTFTSGQCLKAKKDRELFTVCRKKSATGDE
jgi:hypothetical protein